jgi:hypothetical protein
MSGAAGVVVVLALIGGGALALSGGDDRPTGPRLTVRGLVSLTDPATAVNGCHGQGRYEWIHDGAKVMVEADGVVGVGELRNGTPTRSGVCVYDFAVDGVPSGGGSYQVRVAYEWSFPVSGRELRRPVLLSIGGKR